MMTINPPPSPNPVPETDLASRILRARIKKVRIDSCDLDLLDDGGSVIAQGRLYQANSLAWDDARLLKNISDYRQGNLLDAVYLRRLRHEEGQPLWYVHERWGRRNPWDDLALQEGDITTGIIARSIVSARSGEQVGYLVQLDMGAPIRVSESGIIDASDRVQPDIEVLLPNGELPWADGSLGEMPVNDRIGRMPLAIGDPIQAMVREIQMPPNAPVVSLIRLIHHQDAIAEKTLKHRSNLASWRFRGFLGKDKPKGISEKDVQEFTPGDRLYAGRRFLLVDDSPTTLTALSDLLSLMGAEVHAIQVHAGRFSEAVDEVLAAFEDGNFDLALIDNNLPGQNLGQRLIHRAYAQLDNTDPARFVLITADNVQIPKGDVREKLRACNTMGFAQRPLSHASLQRLLAGEEIWEEKKSAADTDQPTEYSPASEASTTPRELLEMIARQTGIYFALLVRASREIQAQDLLAVGNTPFTWDKFPDVVAKTDLHLLIDRRIEELDILPQEGGNESLRLSRDSRSHWRILNFGGMRWIFGIGYAPNMDIHAQLPLWSAALGTAVDAEGWRSWGRHVSSFVQSGLAHQSLSHEVIHLESEFHDLVFVLEDRIEELKPGAELKSKEKKYLAAKVAALRRNNDDLLAFSKYQLQGQALRHREVFLPDAVAAIKRTIASECRKAQVGLRITDPPPLALPLPNAALVLPVVNLLLNAAKHHYRQENRRVELLFSLEERDNEPFLVMDVRDNGPGLTRTALERLWQPGFSSAPDRDQRHGIGLWLSRQLLEEAGGTLELYEHWRGIGSCFRLRFPLHLG
uniref:histidine kinase n=1 Tax=Candidatus Kentrum sp. TUN TaxID=2126343 RepID=A0A450ZX16_9GAMM|nr:MAG: Histidine kinase-, DNA gyrase B-, and HSP90-like ATPase [Candidatus Kentron sp. TUN]